MASLREGSRGEEVTAMGGWQWGWGWRDGEDRFFTSLRYVQNDMWGVRRARKDRGASGRVLRWGWVHAFARTTGGGGFPLPSARGRSGMGRIARTTGRGWVPRIREDNGRGDGFPLPSLRGHALRAGGDGDGSPPPPSRGQDLDARTTGGAWGRGTGGSRTAPTEGEYCRARGSPPSPVFTRAGSNLPPSRGKGFVGDERAIFTVMICGECAALRSGGGREGVVVWVVQLWHSESVR